ncbi:MAG: FAD-dependent oxidoreductase [Betaproteobacteria bacterium]|nr:FAD-dependent oxidoreductase [Betaproteobacteria bacterium]MDE2124409.1 FAD-dependent oxidoreductase [Betaproteobacteria bacterium]MDE2186797.1 FAD-dependent oxidoreductase [Betaproteobacteria bacterium]MDE2325402.1 FAD-dependent oxidoreductase [Betaproteobacteria bacterium]
MAARQRLVLVGAGHAHAEVLRRFAQQPVSDVDLVLVSPIAQAPYSGMMPGWLGGRYAWEDCCIDFAALAAAAGARWVQDEVVALDAAQRLLALASGQTLQTDFVALNIGSTVLAPEPTPGQPLILPTRPLTALRERTEHLLTALSARHTQTPLRVVGVGAGAAGFEMLLGLQARLAAQGVVMQSTLTTRSGNFLPGLSSPARWLALRTLRQRRVALRSRFDAATLGAGALLDAKGGELPADVVLWATGGVAHAWLAQSALAVDARGFVQVDATLRSISHPWLFAVGDCASFTPQALPKSGVFSVRMGPVLANNLHAMLRAQPPAVYQPQRRFLVLLNTGDGRAIASRGALGWQDRWVMRWKDRIDRDFLDRYR